MRRRSCFVSSSTRRQRKHTGRAQRSRRRRFHVLFAGEQVAQAVRGRSGRRRRRGPSFWTPVDIANGRTPHPCARIVEHRPTNESVRTTSESLNLPKTVAVREIVSDVAVSHGLCRHLLLDSDRCRNDFPVPLYSPDLAPVDFFLFPRLYIINKRKTIVCKR